MKHVATIFVAGATALAISACSPVKVRPGSEDIELLSEDRVRNCERLGRTQVSVAERILFVKRGDKAIREDLRRLARNSAVKMDGDTITEESKIESGEQEFGVFKCIED